MNIKEIRSFNYDTQRGELKILITVLEIWERKEYQDSKIKFSIKVENPTNPGWKINFFDAFGSIKKMEDEEKLIEKLKDKIKFWLDRDEPGDFCIEEIILD